MQLFKSPRRRRVRYHGTLPFHKSCRVYDCEVMIPYRGKEYRYVAVMRSQVPGLESGLTLYFVYESEDGRQRLRGPVGWCDTVSYKSALRSINMVLVGDDGSS